MHYLASFILSAAVFVGFYNWLPLDLVTFNEGLARFGSTITTIQGSDTLSASRSVINTNFSNLNTDKLERSQYFSTTTHATITSIPNLATVGTITSGTWNGSTLQAAYGGTGSTTLALNHIMLGNTTSGLKTVAGLGTSGMVLMSNGAGSAPSWQNSSVNQTVSYNWTAHHIFSSLFATNASTTNATTSSLTITGALSSLLKTSSAGLVSAAVGGTDYEYPAQFATGAALTMSGTATSTHTITIPAGRMTSDGLIDIFVEYTKTGGNGNETFSIDMGDGVSTSTLYYVSTSQTSPPKQINVKVGNDNSLSSQFLSGNAASSTMHWFNSTAAVNTTNQFYITISGRKGHASDTMIIRQARVLIQQ